MGLPNPAGRAVTSLRRWTGLGLAAALALSGAAVGTACGGGDEAVQERGVGPGGGAAQPQKAPAKAPAEEEHAALEPGMPLKHRDLPESAFVETDENRDPFRSYIQVFNVQAVPAEELARRQPVLLEEHALEELRLIAIVSGQGGNPRAMLVDPEGKGWVVRRGDYVGRGERIRLGPGQPEQEINWRVVRVRPDRIILVRDDPMGAGPQVTRVMRLYPEDET